MVLSCHDSDDESPSMSHKYQGKEKGKGSNYTSWMPLSLLTRPPIAGTDFQGAFTYSPAAIRQNDMTTSHMEIGLCVSE